jgi:transposase
MINRDFRKLNNDTQAELRRLALLNINKGKTIKYVAELMDIHIQTVRDWIRKEKVLKQRNYQGLLRGRKLGEGRILDNEKALLIKNIILYKTPNDIGLESALWTRRNIQNLIKQELNITLPMSTIGLNLGKWGLSSQRPGKEAKEQDKDKIDNWIHNVYPMIQKQAKQENAIIKFSDETGISLNTYYGKSYGLKGHTPVIKLPAKKAHISMISSIDKRGLSEFMLYEGGLNSELFILFLKRQIDSSSKKIYLIVDNLMVHKSKLVKEWVKDNESKITLFFPATIRTAV